MNEMTGTAGQIADAIGAAAALGLMAERGGTEISIPVRAVGSALACIIGIEATTAMIAVFGPGKLLVPCGPGRGQKARRQRAMRMLREGRSLREVALSCDVHVRSVSNYRATLDKTPDPDAPELPFDK